MLKVTHFSAKGVKLESFSLPKIFAKKVSPYLIAQALRVYEANAHFGLAKAKTRGEVNRTKKKTYAQKHTGKARHGSRSAPIFVGGGKAHGPRPIKRVLKLTQKMSKTALNTVLSYKAENKKLVVVDSLASLKKTTEAQKLVDRILSGSQKTKITFILAFQNKDVVKIVRNLKNSDIEFFPNLNAYKAYFGGLLVFDKEIFSREKKGKTENKKSK